MEEACALHNHGEAFEAVVVGAKLWLFLPPLPALPPTPTRQVRREHPPVETHTMLRAATPGAHLEEESRSGK